MGVKVFIKGQEVPKKTIKDWEQKRVDFISDFLTKELGTPKVATAEELTDLKMTIPEQKMREITARNCKSNDVTSGMLAKISRGKTAFCEVEMEVAGASAQEIHDQYFGMMFDNNEANRRLNLSANPDHMLLIGRENNEQEVIEASGGLSKQSLFYVCFGQENGLNSKADSAYPSQATGICRIQNGTVIGGVRHQMRDTTDGCHVKLVVEFPKITPKKILAQHEIHLACEFSNWINAWVERAQAART
ncbi:hypothetical protein [Aminicella lysinilytica]|uniref:Uncharacterized protein n=1 Tax=Aminicella lysinilytica TaxID=433323 RepID=A0A4R6QGB7_9FIRM|nr:hypothetical protein [Aminicella lysinilytica]TDP60579.1 hypothetical protein EV211_10194 [Aminicella lysinilytica]